MVGRADDLLNSTSEPAASARFRLRRFSVASFWRGVCLQGIKEMGRRARNLVDSAEKRFFVCGGRFIKSSDLPDKLQRGCSDFFLGDAWFEVKERFDTSTHVLS